MTFFQRYIAGETDQVYKEILELGQDAFLPSNLPEVEKVLAEIFRRTRFNLDIIYQELVQQNYVFKTGFRHNFERPLHPPLEDTDLLLDNIQNAIKAFGQVPLSLVYFYKIVGGVNFVWDYEKDENLLWQMADPIQVVSLDELLESVTDQDWIEMTQERIADEESPSLILSADVYHKDNISGGPPYSLEITPHKSFDSIFLDEPHETTFINYLRICFEDCGFPGIRNSMYANNYETFFEKVHPRLLKL